MKKILVISLMLALVLALLMPSAVMADRHSSVFSAQGTLTGIDTGKVKRIGSTDQWQVRDRTITGTLAGDLNGNFALKYDGIFQLPSQAGNLEGILKIKNTKLSVRATVEPLSFPPLFGGAPVLNISGTWKGQGELNANGTFQAFMAFIPDSTGHVVQILASAFTMTGNYTDEGKDKDKK